VSGVKIRPNLHSGRFTARQILFPTEGIEETSVTTARLKEIEVSKERLSRHRTQIKETQEGIMTPLPRPGGQTPSDGGDNFVP